MSTASDDVTIPVEEYKLLMAQKAKEEKRREEKRVADRFRRLFIKAHGQEAWDESQRQKKIINDQEREKRKAAKIAKQEEKKKAREAAAESRKNKELQDKKAGKQRDVLTKYQTLMGRIARAFKQYNESLPPDFSESWDSEEVMTKNTDLVKGILELYNKNKSSINGLAGIPEKAIFKLPQPPPVPPRDP